MEFQLTYRLVQQTPIIHFQHDQQGATLRATEVKPKLDRFIIKKMGWTEKFEEKEEREKIRKEYKDWFIGDTDALNYKMRIVTTGEPERSCMAEYEIAIKPLKDLLKKKKFELERSYSRALDEECRRLDSKIKGLTKKRDAEINSMYFGNMVSSREKNYEEAVRETYKETVFYKGTDQIHLNIICFVGALKEKIEECMEEFFFVNNFGSRQSKGFGGFTAVKNIDGKEIPPKEPIETLSEKGYRFFYAEVNGDSSVMLNHAKNIYAVMKGGYNHTKFDSPDSYIKGYIQRYFIDDYIDENVGSDKAFIKKYKRKKVNESPKKIYDDFIFSRAMLGLADYFEFRDRVRGGRVEIFSLGEKDFDVERFRSPVTIKIIANKLIFLFGSFDAICDKTFYFAPNPDCLDERFVKFSYEQKKSYILENVNKKDVNGNILFVPIETMKKFDDEDIIFFINVFCEYFMEEKYKFGKFHKDETIPISRNIELIVPKHIERSF